MMAISYPFGNNRPRLPGTVLKLLFPACCFATWVACAARAQQVEGIEPNRGGTISYETRDPKVALERFHLAEGYAVNLFASEREFPIGNPVAINFDAKGRLWVSTMPSYPQRLPDEDPDDLIVILEDADRDGTADKHTVFLRGLHLPAGFELGDGGAYIAQQPNLIFAKDTDGDDVADYTEVVLHGFGTEDSHHAISAFTWGPEGGLYFQEGTFHHSQVETPYGPVRLVDAGVFRYEPKTFRLEVFVSYPFANPWGHVFDRWGQNFIADASGGANYFGTAITGNAVYPEKRSPMKVFTSIVRPTSGCEIVSSRHFPDEAQGNFLVNNVIGFQGIKQHRMIEEGSGFTSEEVEPLLYSTDINFRPVDLEFGPDGALYVVDWFNPLIGHMQYSLRDPNRDHGHGRVWRVTYPARPLVTPPNIDGEPVPALLELLKTYEDRARYRARLELRERDPRVVTRELEKWIDNLDKSDPDYEHHLLEALWVYQNINVYAPELLERVLLSPEPRARAAAVRVARFWRRYLDDPIDLFLRTVNDEHPRVRLETLLALSYLTSGDAAKVAMDALSHPTDYYLDYVLNETIKTLAPWWKPLLKNGEVFAAGDETVMRYLLDHVPGRELLEFVPNEHVYWAWLTREDIDQPRREEALRRLAEVRDERPVDLLLAALRELDARDGRRIDETVAELGRLLSARPPRELDRGQSALIAFATAAKRPAAAQAAFAAALTRPDGRAAAWDAATRNPAAMPHLLQAASRVNDPAIAQALYPSIQRLIRDPASSLGRIEEARIAGITAAAMDALVAISERKRDAFDFLYALNEDPALTGPKLLAIARVPEADWPADHIAPLAQRLTDHVRGLAIDQLSTPNTRALFRFGERLAERLPEAGAAALRRELGNLGVTTITIRPIPHVMLFDTKLFIVRAGRPVEIVLENGDIMPHNLVITAPGALAEVGQAAEATSTAPGAEERHYVPESPKVLYATRLVFPGDRDRLNFLAPDAPGDYPFVCTYPGHWILMNGVMRVVSELDDALLAQRIVRNDAPEAAASARPFVRMWEVADLASEIHRVHKGRSFERGRMLFETAGCAKCHTVNGQGAAVGPDLTHVREKFAGVELLRQIIEPSAIVEDEFVSFLVDTNDFESYSGFILEETDSLIRLRGNPQDPQKTVTLSKAEIASMTRSPLSAMPTGLLTTLTHDDIFDLLAYLESGGDPSSPFFIQP